MIDVVQFVVGLAADLLRGRAALVAEDALLRQQRPFDDRSARNRSPRFETVALWLMTSL
jgi:hypothetical protein